MFFLTGQGLINEAAIEVIAYHPVHEDDGTVTPMWRIRTRGGDDHMVEGVAADGKIREWIRAGAGGYIVDFSGEE